MSLSFSFRREGVFLAVLGLSLLSTPIEALASARNYHYYPSTTPQFSSQLEIETVSLLFRNNNILVSDTRHTLIFINASGLPETVPQVDEKGVHEVKVQSGQAVVVGGNTHTAPLSSTIPQPALLLGLSPLSISESGDLIYIAEGNGRIEALNLTNKIQDIILIPDSRIRINAGAHIPKLLKRSPTMGKLLGMATTMPLQPGYLSDIAGGGHIALGAKPIDALRARISPISISANQDGIYIVGETGHILFLNNTSAPRLIPVLEGKILGKVLVRPGQIFLAASRDADTDPRPGPDPFPAYASTMTPVAIVASGDRLFTADREGEIFEINLSESPIPIPFRGDNGDFHELGPGMGFRIAGGGTHLIKETPMSAIKAMLRPRSLAYDPQRGILYIGDIEDTLEAGLIQAVNVSDHPVTLPIMREGTFRKVVLEPGKILSVVGNAERTPVTPPVPVAAGDVGIEPVQLSYRNGLLVVGDLLGRIDIVNMTMRNRRAFPNARFKSTILPPGTIISLMGNRRSVDTQDEDIP